MADTKTAETKASEKKPQVRRMVAILINDPETGKPVVAENEKGVQLVMPQSHGAKLLNAITSLMEKGIAPNMAEVIYDPANPPVE